MDSQAAEIADTVASLLMYLEPEHIIASWQRNGFRIFRGSRFRVQGFGFRIKGPRAQSLYSETPGSLLRVLGVFGVSLLWGGTGSPGGLFS